MNTGTRAVTVVGHLLGAVDFATAEEAVITLDDGRVFAVRSADVLGLPDRSCTEQARYVSEEAQILKRYPSTERLAGRPVWVPLSVVERLPKRLAGS